MNCDRCVRIRYFNNIQERVGYCYCFLLDFCIVIRDLRVFNHSCESSVDYSRLYQPNVPTNVSAWSPHGINILHLYWNRSQIYKYPYSSFLSHQGNTIASRCVRFSINSSYIICFVCLHTHLAFKTHSQYFTAYFSRAFHLDFLYGIRKLTARGSNLTKLGNEINLARVRGNERTTAAPSPLTRSVSLSFPGVFVGLRDDPRIGHLVGSEPVSRSN